MPRAVFLLTLDTLANPDLEKIFLLLKVGLIAIGFLSDYFFARMVKQDYATPSY